MNTDQTAVVTVNAKSPNVRTFEFDAADSDAAASLGLVLAGDVEERLTRAAAAYNTATRLAVDAGYLLLSVKADLPHGAFEDRINGMGMSRMRAAELMSMAKFATALPPERRQELLKQPKTKLMLLAGADPEVIADVLDSEDTDINALSVRELRAKLKEREKALMNTDAELEQVKFELTTAQKRLHGERVDRVPTMVADIRAEVLAQEAKITLAMQSLESLVGELVGMESSVLGDWADGTLRLALGALHKTALLTRSAISAVASHLPEGEAGEPAQMSQLSPQEQEEQARRYAAIVKTHTYEADMRKWERSTARPKGKGRPMAKPVAPTEAI